MEESLTQELWPNSNPIAPVYVNYSNLIDELLKPRPNSFGFQVEGMMFQARIIPDADGQNTRMKLDAEIGYIPFTAESSAKRKYLKTIIEGTKNMQHAHFVVDDTGKIRLTSDVFINVKEETAEISFARVIILIHQVLPYVRLIGRYI